MSAEATTLLLILIGLASVAVLARLFIKHIDGRPLVQYEPRRPVPWNFLAPLIILAPTLWTVARGFLATPVDLSTVADTAAAAAVSATASTAQTAAPAIGLAAAASYELSGQLTTNEHFVSNTVMQAAALVFLTATCYLLLTAVFRAQLRDVGLPTSWRQLFQDVGLGAAAFLATLVPVYVIQAALTFAFEPKQVHPLIEQLHTEHSPPMMLAAALAAIIAAPLFEETAFRLVFQGWLERVEDKRLAADEPGQGDRPPGFIADIPHGWLPILITATLFSLAHLGHGVAPISLFILGVTLGYLYQRTHRIVPCMTCHALFNLLSLGMLWLVLNSESPPPLEW